MELKKVKGKTYGKGRDKRNVKSENVNFKKKQDTIEDPHNKHTVENQCCSWTTPLKIVWVLFFNGVLIKNILFWFVYFKFTQIYLLLYILYI